jgi:hypothetical protein
MDETIDAVYTWVDGSDPEFRRSLRTHSQAEGSPPFPLSVDPQRFRDNGELRYSLRSLEAFAPWVRKIYLVTNGQIPEWLDTSNKRISIITHRMIFGDTSHLPTFNSNAIELQLHKIPHLSRRFLYFNDDCFLGRRISREDLVTSPEGQVVYFQPTLLHRDGKAGPVHDRSYAYTQAIVDRLWGRKSYRLLPAHVPRLFDRDILKHLEALLADEYKRASSCRFRCGEDLALSVLYNSFLLESPEEMEKHEFRLLAGASRDYYWVMLNTNIPMMWRTFLGIVRRKPQFFCINDDLGGVHEGHITLKSLRLLLHLLFPRPSSFEK